MGFRGIRDRVRYCPHTVTVYNGATIKGLGGLIYLYYEYCSVTGWAQYPDRVKD